MAALTAALLGATALNGLNKYASQRRQGSIARQQGDTEQALFNINAGAADASAQDSITRGQEAEARQRLGMRELRGGQRAAFAGQGVQVDSGSAADVVEGDQSIGEMDALQIRQNAWREAHGYKTQASFYRFQGDMAATAGRNRQRSMNNEAFSTLLTTGGELFDQYGQLKSGMTKVAPRIARGSGSGTGPSSSYGGYRSGTAAP